jgi:glycine/D-amino acid oxidase-like deaminating enzyme
MARASRSLPGTASVVIVGGGVIGTSCAFHLAEAGVDGVVLLERNQLGSGSSGRAAGGVRAQFSDAINVALAQRSLSAFADFGRRPGFEIDLHQVGYLFVLTREEDIPVFERSVAIQRELGVRSEIVSPQTVRELCPLLSVDDVLAGVFSPSDGHATPDSVVQGYASGARAHGATLATETEVVEVVVEGGQVRAVVTADATIETGTVICAAGAWSRALGDLAGVELPVTPLRRQILFTEALPGLPAKLPMTIDFTTSFYFHREGPGVLMGMPAPGERRGFDVELSDEFIPALLEVAERRAPELARVGIKGSWTGYYELSPDHNALIGETPDVSRFIYATGFSGHGFLQAPAVGEVVRDLVLRRTPVVDVSPLSVQRFSEPDALRPEFNVV